MRTVYFKKDNYLYRRSHNKQSLTDLRKHAITWFAMQPGYGSDSTYGPIVTSWRVEERVSLLDISKKSYRVNGLNSYLKDANIPFSLDDLSCDYQYSGGDRNKRFHKIIEPLLAEWGLDGTYIHEDDSDEDCEGASEVVIRKSSLWKFAKM